MTIREIDDLVERIDRLVTEEAVDWRTRSWPVRRQLLRDLVTEAVRE